AWQHKYLGGDLSIRREFEDLTAAKLKANRIDDALSGKVVPSELETISGDEISSRHLAHSINDFRDVGVDEGVLRNFLHGEPIKPADRRLVEIHKKQLLSNADFTKRYLAGDAVAVKEMTTVNMHLTREVAREG
ncbi:MAG: hypothetical protein ACREDL_04000, partial [Bradyrhizobium sp.]